MPRPVPGASRPSLLAALVRTGRWPRAALAVVCLLLAAVSALRPGRAASAKGVPVVVAARSLPAGHLLTVSDLVVERVPDSVRPAGARAAPSTFAGQRLAGPVTVREVLTGARLVGRDLTAGLGDDLVAAAVDVGTDVRTFVRAGDHVDLIAVPSSAVDGTTSGADQGARTVGERLLVLAVTPSSDSSGGVLTSSAGTGSTQLVLAVDRALAVRIAALETSGLFAVVASSP